MKLCVTTVVDGGFQRYTPLFILSLLTAYPDYSVRVFVRDDIGPELAAGIELLGGIGDWQIIAGALDGYPKCKRLGAWLRYLLFTRERVARHFSGFDYVYITDGDMLITRETPALHVQHIEHMKAIGLPYSDILRHDDRRVATGLLFASQAFIERVGDTVGWYDAEFRVRGEDMIDTQRKSIPDERLLYQIIRDSGVGVPPQHMLEDDPLQERLSDPANCHEQVFRPWHGMNLGAGFAKPELNMIRLDLPYRAESARQIATLIATPIGKACTELLGGRQRKALARCVGAV